MSVIEADIDPPLTPEFVFRTRAERMRVIDHWWRDQMGHCCICKEVMEPYHRGMRSSNPEAATIEHLIPKRDGGPDTLGNVRLAHMRCNAGLGSLHSMNKHRAEKGLPPLTDEWAIGWAREQWTIKLAKRAAMESGVPYVAPVLLFPMPDQPVKTKITNHAEAMKTRKKPLRNRAVRRMALGVPRGATLPGYVPPVDILPPRRAVAPPARSLLDGVAIKATPMRKQPTCQTCGSADITQDASLRWDMTRQEWVIHEFRGGFDCDECASDTAPKWDTVR